MGSPSLLSSMPNATLKTYLAAVRHAKIVQGLPEVRQGDYRAYMWFGRAFVERGLTTVHSSPHAYRLQQILYGNFGQFDCPPAGTTTSCCGPIFQFGHVFFSEIRLFPCYQRFNPQSTISLYGNILQRAPLKVPMIVLWQTVAFVNPSWQRNLH